MTETVDQAQAQPPRALAGVIEDATSRSFVSTSHFEGSGFRETHIAFVAPDRAAVRAFFQAAVSVDAEVLHEPRVWPQYRPGYYGAFVRDPDGKNVEAVCRAPA